MYGPKSGEGRIEEILESTTPDSSPGDEKDDESEMKNYSSYPSS